MTHVKKNLNNLFYIFITLHLFIWTLVPTLTNVNLPLDTIEALAWGSNLEWGFNKHPPASAFLVAVFYKIFGTNDWAYYLLSQICVIISFFVVWKLSLDFLKNKIHSLVAVLLLEGIYFYNYTTPEFNVYICELPFWALTVFFAWEGYNKNNIKSWILLGIFSAIGFLSHYLFIYLLLGIKVFFWHRILKDKRFDFKYFISGTIFILIIIPHLIWLKENNFVTLSYGMHRTGLKDFNFLDHFEHPFIFFLKQIGILVPFFIMSFILIEKVKPKLDFNNKRLLFLITTIFGPLIFIILTSIVLGIKIRTMWMTPFYLFMGLFMVYIFQKKINLKKFNNFISIFIILFFLSPITYAYISITETSKRTDYPGKEIADLVQSRWDKNFSNEIGIVVGDEWFGGNLSYHLKSRPKWFLKEIPKNLDFKGGVIYTGNKDVLKSVCPGIYGSIKRQDICMVGAR